MSDEGLAWSLGGAWACSFQSYIILHVKLGAEQVSVVICKYGENGKGGVLIINFFFFSSLLLFFFNGSFVYLLLRYAMPDVSKERWARNTLEKMNINHLTVLPKKPQTLMFIHAQLGNKTTKSHLAITSLCFYLLSSSHLPSPSPPPSLFLSLFCVCVLVVLLLYVYTLVIDSVWFALLP